MAVTLTYDPVLSRVRVTADGLGAAADATVERSLDGITWTVVRGGHAATVSGGALVSAVDDYEFRPGVVNTYRVRTLGAAVTHVATGAAAHADNVAVVPALPAGAVANDLLLILAVRRGAGLISTPTGYTLLVNVSDRVKLFGKVHSGSEVAPTVPVAGGAAGDSVSAQLAAFRNAALTVAGSATQVNGTAGQNIPFPALLPPQDRCLLLVAGYKLDDFTSVAPLAGMTEVGELSTTLGNDHGAAWDHLVQDGAVTVDAGTLVVTGGTATTSYSFTAALAPASVTSQTNTITPSLTSVWLKWPLRPYLNRAVTVTDWSDVAHLDRTGVFPVAGRSRPVAVTDVRPGRSYTLQVKTETLAAAEELGLVLAAGETVHVHVPSNCPVPAMHAAVGQVTESRRAQRATRRYFSLPLTEVATPDPRVVGSTATCQTVVNTYATCADVVAAHPTCASLLELIGSPTEVIVP